ncbi:hypothetical protein N656DRAFT_777582 [Canariomyces notabilis]|uniref:ribonuclease Z n=1 Tax=Canariomyces notabilis TaxID=2074819 RepID=A0AAN6YUD8_9PEZI|nr:hypothetical protein N656DRAFT_777582 [Canariomyces arenarius]
MHATRRSLLQKLPKGDSIRVQLQPQNLSEKLPSAKNEAFWHDSNFYARSPTKKNKKLSPLVQDWLSPRVQDWKPPQRPTILSSTVFPNIISWRIPHTLHHRHSLRFVLFPTDKTLTLFPASPLTSQLSPSLTRRSAREMHSYVQIVSTPTADTPGACLMLHFDTQRYLFGSIAEGTQRVMVQRKIPLAKTRDIFLTGRIDWQSTGGLLGMILTIADIKGSKAEAEKSRPKGKSSPDFFLNVHGGRNLMHNLAAARRFILRKGLPLRPREVRHDPRLAHGKTEPDYTDENIRVWSVLLSGQPPDAGSVSGQRSPKRRKLSPSSGKSTDSDGSAAEGDSDVDQRVREAIVKDMFDSNWKLDTLRELKLGEVELPAKIFVRSDKGHLEPYQGPLPGEEGCDKDLKVLVRLPWPASMIEELPRARPSGESMCYVVKSHPRRGKFDPAAATALGVVRTDFKNLTAGLSVPGKDGVVVTPEMVMGPMMAGRGFAIIDLPSPEFVDVFLNRPEWTTPEIMDGVETMYWILPDKSYVEGESRLLDFMKAHASMKHVLLGHDISPNTLALESPAAQLIKMHRIDPDRFPLPIFDSTKLDIEDSLATTADVGRPGARFQLAPKVSYPTDALVPIMDTGEPLRELLDTPQTLELADAARAKVSDPSFLAQVAESQKDLPVPDAEIITLGTGSALPSKYRNVSATLIRVPGWGSYLLDCGENTLGQLRRSFGYKGADEILTDLRAIYISHAHADHHLGTVTVLTRWLQLDRARDPKYGEKKLTVIATPKYHGFLDEVESIQPGLRSKRIARVSLRGNLKPVPGTRARVVLPEGISSPSTLGLPEISACFVEHCYEATAVVLTFPDTGFKVAYSGDCRPSFDLFTELGRGAHLLLHECTFDDELKGDAIAKKHSTLSEALDVGRRMAARRILLTHFSQRYPKLPVINEESLRRDNTAAGGDVEVLFAFDHMRVKLGEFKQAKEFIPALRELLREEEEGEGKVEDVNTSAP